MMHPATVFGYGQLYFEQPAFEYYYLQGLLQGQSAVAASIAVALLRLCQRNTQ